MKIKYVGSIETGTLVDPFNQRPFPFKRNEPIEVPDETAKKLLGEQPAENPDWIAAVDESPA